jgi:hypothetical protein
MKNRLVIFLLILFNSILLPQKQYFVAKDGTRDFSTILQVNDATLNPGDIVSFASGENYADAVLICKKGVTYNSYGIGKAIIGDSTINLSLKNTIYVNYQNVTLDNLKIYGYKDAETAIRVHKSGVSITNCIISGGENVHKGWRDCITLETPEGSTDVTITNNIIRGAGRSAINFIRPYNVDIGHNEIYDLYRLGARVNEGAHALARSEFSDGGSPADIWDCAYTVRVHHNNIHHFDMGAFMGYSRMLIEYNEIHSNLDERIYTGGAKHGTVGKLWDGDANMWSLGLIFRYNYVHDLVRRGQKDHTYGKPIVSGKWITNEDVVNIVSTNNTGASDEKTVYLNVGHPAAHDVDLNGDGILDYSGGPDAVLSGLGYSNFYIHNNIFYKCSNVIINRSFNYSSFYKSDLPSYFLNNTIIDCGQSYVTVGWGLLQVINGSESGPYYPPNSPHYYINNIVDYVNPSAYAAQVHNTMNASNNIFLNDSGATKSLTPGKRFAWWLRGDAGRKSIVENEQYLVNDKSIWNDTSTTIWNDAVGVAGVRMLDVRIKIGGAANNKGKAYSEMGDNYTISSAQNRWTETHMLGQDPTGRSFAYDIFGNFRTSNDIGAVGVAKGSLRSPNNGLKVILEGSYSNGNLKTDLVKAQLLPSKQPYNVHPWNITGDISLTNGSENYVDWVLVQIREDLTNTKYWKVGILNNDGLVLNPDGTSFSFSGLATGEYYLIIKHRNHLSIMSAQKVFIEKGKPVDYDFTDSQNKAYGGNSMADLGDGKFGMIAGDGNADGVVNVLDYSSVANNILSRGYAQGDMDMNGVMNVLDYSFISRNILKKSNLP